MHDSQKRLRDLCKQAMREKDQEKLKGLVDRILEILAERQKVVEMVH
jgi:hypothetical protein